MGLLLSLFESFINPNQDWRQDHDQCLPTQGLRRVWGPQHWVRHRALSVHQRLGL